ncbi:MAG: heavy metal sensor histidine kinase [Bacteroidetes bacterium]|nr:heavy metal sensor histidine kinase [Bacteroidota bacterium]
MSLSLRARLTLWFWLVMAMSLAVFAVLTYTSVSGELSTNLDISLYKVISSLDIVIRKKAENPEEKQDDDGGRRGGKKDDLAFLKKDSLRKDTTIRPTIKSSKDNEIPAKRSGDSDRVDAIWTSIYEHIILTPRNFMIEVMDSTGTIVYRSDNLKGDSIALGQSFLRSVRDSAQYASLEHVPKGRKEPEAIRVAVARSRSAVIVVAYPITEMESLLKQFFSFLIILGPAVLLLSSIGGWFLARASLHPVDEITRTAKDITASNLSRRLPESKSNDEIGRLSETLNDMISRLESSFERIRQFTADASHELRTPLTILTGELELALRTRKTPREYEDVLSSALQEVLRLSHVVESLLLLSRTDMAQVSLHMEPTNLTETLADLADAATILGTQKDVYITFRHSETFFIMADHAKLYQMFLNLVDNAVKYTPEGGMISIAVHRDGKFAEVRVRDTGIGISPEHRKKIFDRFYRVDKARSRELGGAGLGLSIVQWIVEIHGGTIAVESEPGQGSTFIVRLPLLEETPKAENVPAASPKTRAFELSRFLRRSVKAVNPAGEDEQK